MRFATLDGTPATLPGLIERADAWYERHGAGGLGGWEPVAPVPVGPPPYSARCRSGHHAECSGQRLAERKDGGYRLVVCECPHHAGK